MTVVYGFIAMAIVLVATFTALIAVSRHVRQAVGKLSQLQKELDSVKKEQLEAQKGVYGMGQRMIKLEKRLRLLADAPLPEPVDDTPFSYSQAAQMIQQGADDEAVAATCGLSHSEAHLMRKLCREGLATS